MLAWKEIVESPNLKNLPYKIETNEWGQIVMTPACAKHRNYQSILVLLLSKLISTPGEVVVECAIQTPKGTKVADVAWFSAERWQIVQDEYDVTIAPQICIEVVSPGNSEGELRSKRKLYFEAGALETWVCNAEGVMHFYNAKGEIEQSELAPEFPKKIK